MMKRILPICTLFLLAGFLYSCNDTFEPLEENTKYVYSIYGTLDVHADTQWVRVMPIGDRLFNDNPVHDGTIVTLTHLPSGNVTQLKDSMFVFAGPSYVWNYYTTEPLIPGNPYELKATATDGRFSYTRVVTAEELPLPRIDFDRSTDRGFVEGSNSQKLVVAVVKFWVQWIDDFGNWTDEETHAYSVLNTAFINQYTNVYRFQFDTRTLLTRSMGIPFSRIRLNKVELQVGSGLTSWPSYAGLSDEESIMPDVITNITDGTGYIATVASHKIIIPHR